MGATDILERKVLTHLLRGETLASFTPVVALGLATASGIDETGSAFVPGTDEMSGSGYARVDLTGGAVTYVFDSADIAAYTGASPLTNANQIVFPQATGAWPAIRYWLILDDATDELLAWGQFGADLTVATGQRVTFDVGQFAATVE
jgi:hypothetical protein